VFAPVPVVTVTVPQLVVFATQLAGPLRVVPDGEL
jgi:hypothetical protein